MAEKRKVEKVWGFTVASFFALIGVHIAKYFIDFHLLPKLFPSLFPLSLGAVGLWLASSIIISTLCMKFISRFGYFYPIAIFFYALCIVFWPMGAYGFGDIIPSILGAIIAGVALDLIQRGILWIFIFIGFITM